MESIAVSETNYERLLKIYKEELRRVAPDELLGFEVFTGECGLSVEEICENCLWEIARITGESFEMVVARLKNGKGNLHV